LKDLSCEVNIWCRQRFHFCPCTSRPILHLITASKEAVTGVTRSISLYFQELIIALSEINEQLREQSIRAVNTSLTFRNWFFGFYIVAFEQNGKDRAEYGTGLFAHIAAEMKALAIPNSNERELSQVPLVLYDLSGCCEPYR
jgi:hypothetical protein